MHIFFNLLNNLVRGYYHHFMNEKTEAQSREVFVFDQQSNSDFQQSDSAPTGAFSGASMHCPQCTCDGGFYPPFISREKMENKQLA